MSFSFFLFFLDQFAKVIWSQYSRSNNRRYWKIEESRSWIGQFFDVSLLHIEHEFLQVEADFELYKTLLETLLWILSKLSNLLYFCLLLFVSC